LEKLNLISGNLNIPLYPIKKPARSRIYLSSYQYKSRPRRVALLRCFCNCSVIFRFTIYKTTGIGEDNYEAEAVLSSHIPEILPIGGRRLHVSYIGQLKQCKNCFNIGHIAATCESNKVDWLEYVATLHKSGKFKAELFDGWMPSLKQYHSDYKDPLPAQNLQQNNLDLSNIAQNSHSRNFNQRAQDLNQGQNQNQWNPNPNFQNNQGYYSGQNNPNRGRGRSSFRGFNRGNNRGRFQKRGYSGSSNYFSTY